MNTADLAAKLVEMCRNGQNLEFIDQFYADNVVSVEPKGAPAPLTEGKEAVKAKSEGFFASVEEFHSGETSDALVAANFFTVVMKMDITMKGMGRMQMEEIAVYQVENGKIVYEEFFFPVPTM